MAVGIREKMKCGASISTIHFSSVLRNGVPGNFFSSYGCKQCTRNNKFYKETVEIIFELRNFILRHLVGGYGR